MIGGLIGAGFGLGIGSSVVGRMPVTGTTSGIQSGLTTGANFIPIGVNIHAGGMIVRGLRNLDPRKKKRLPLFY